MDDIENLREEEARRERRRSKPLPRRIKHHPSLRFKRKNLVKVPSIDTHVASSFSRLNEIGKDPGLEIWKQIDKDTLEQQLKSTHGQFSTDRCYIVLQTLDKDAGATREFTIHSWIGEDVKNKEEEISAVEDKVAELEMRLQSRGIVVIHTEVQAKESDVFLSYFKRGGIQYNPPAQLKKVDFEAMEAEKLRKKLYHLKGKRYVRVRQVDPTYKSMNSSDVFVLDCDDIIYQWNGRKANRMKKAKGLDITVRLRDERGAKAKVVVLDENKDDGEFWEALGEKGEIPESSGDDTAFEKAALSEMKLYSVRDTSNHELEVTEVDTEGHELSASMLDPKECYILDCKTEIFVWVGKDSTEAEKAAAMSNAKEFLTAYNRPSYTRITKMSQGAEIAMFKDKFKIGTWGEFVPTYEYKVKDNIATGLKQEKVNIDQLHNPQKYLVTKEEFKDVIPSAQQVENGKLQLWYIKEHKKHDLPANEFGVFYNSNSYMMLFTIPRLDGGEKYVLYYWQGRHSTKEDKGTAALLTQEVGHSLGQNCIQVRVTQNKEPPHFLSHFKGFLVKKGKREEAAEELTGLFQIGGNNEYNTSAFEVDKVASSLNSNDPYLLITPTRKVIWFGKGTNEDEKNAARQIAKKVVPDGNFQEIEEGNEDDEYWNELGGKGEYSTFLRLRGSEKRPARLFQCSNASGVFKVSEIYSFSQDDLDNENVYILDVYTEVFLWVGNASNEVKRKGGLDTAIKYVAEAPDDRQDCPIYLIQPGKEPSDFTCHFYGWDTDKAKIVAKIQNSYEAKLESVRHRIGPGFRTDSIFGELFPGLQSRKAKLEKEEQRPRSNTGNVTNNPPLSIFHQRGRASTSTPIPANVIPTEEDEKLRRTPVYDYDRLTKKPIPSDIEDPKHLERHLSDEDFHKVFKMGRAAFESLPQWRQLNLKKSANIF